MKIHDLQEARTRAVTEMRALADKVEGEARDYSDTEDQRHKQLKAEIAGLDSKIERARDVMEIERSAPAIVSPGNVGDGRYEERARGFSLIRAINARLGDPVDAGFEREISAEVARRSGRKFLGIAVPDEYFTTEKRTLTVSGDAASLYPTQHRGDLFIDMLRSALVTGRLGATILDGLVGDQDIPKQTASSEAQWVGEDGEITATDADFDDVNLSPKTVGAIASYSRRTLINAVPSIEGIVRRDLASVIARAIDLQAIVGDGQSNRPLGVINQQGAHQLTLTGSATGLPGWAQVLEFIASIESADADIGGMGWAMTPRAVAKFRASPRLFEDNESIGLVLHSPSMLMDTPNSLAGYPVATTTALPSDSASTTVVFGAWSQLLVGYWSGVDILVNPYESAAYSRGRVLVRAMRDVDVAVRHAESFAYANDLAI